MVSLRSIMPIDPNHDILISPSPDDVSVSTSWRNKLCVAAAFFASCLTTRIGPGRALMLAVRSRLFRTAAYTSVRQSDFAELRNKVMQKQWGVTGHEYVVVVGDRGVGKSTLIDAATARTAGVVELTVFAGTPQEDIVEQALRAVINSQFKLMDPIVNAHRVLWWYKLFFGKSPLVIIQLSERDTGESYAQITGAVRQLTDTYKLRVIIDSSPNALSPRAISTDREKIMYVPPMTREMIKALPQLASLFGQLERAQLTDVVWEVLGGSPAKFESLASEIQKDNDGKKLTEIVEKELQHRITFAIDTLTSSTMNNADLSKLIQLYEDARTGFVTMQQVKAKGIKLSSPDKVFRKISREQEGEMFDVLVPASNALTLVIDFKLTKAPTLQHLVQLVRPASKASKAL